MLCHSIYLQVVKVLLFNLALQMNRYTFVLPSENQNAFACSPSAQMPFKCNTVTRSEFLQRYTRNIEIRRQVLRVKRMTKFKKNTHLSLSLHLSICRCTLIFLRGGPCTCLSLFLSLLTFAKTVWIQIRPEWNSEMNVSSI